MAQAVNPTSVPAALHARAGSSVRSRMGVFSVLVFTVATIGLSFSGLTPFASLAGLFPGTDLALVSTVAMLACLMPAITYALIGAAVKQDAADYILASRVVSPALAFAFSWTLVIFGGLGVGVLIAAAGQVILPVYMRSIAVIAGAPGMLLSADFLSSPDGVSIVGSTGVALAFLISILPPKVNLRFFQVGFFLLILSWVLLIVMLAFPIVSFGVSWDRFMGEGVYASQLAAANAAGMQSPSGPYPLLAAGLMGAMWIFFGFQSPAWVAGQVEKPEKSLLPGSLLALLLAWAAVGAAAVFLQRQVSSDWLSAQSFLAMNGEATMPYLNLYAAVLRPDPLLISILGLAWLVALLNMAQAYLAFTSRIMVAWGREGLLPETIGYHHPQLKSPMVAVLIVAILAQVGVWLVARGTLPILGGLYVVFFAVFVQVLPMLAAFLAPFTRRAWFGSLGRPATASLGPVPLISITAFFSLVILGGVLAYSLTSPAFVRPAIESLLLLAGLVAAGLLYYVLRRRAVPRIDPPFGTFPDTQN